MKTLGSLVFVSVLASPGGVLGTQETASLSGRLTTAEAPLQGCTVSLFRLNESETEFLENIVTSTDTSGKYQFTGIPSSGYVLLGSCENRRVYQGKLKIQSGHNTRDIELTDPFSGRWKLDRSRSTMGAFSAIRDEIREYTRSGSTTSMSWVRTASNGRRTKGAYSFRCDGTEMRAGGQTITCRFLGPDSVEGYQSPPRSFYLRQVDGDTMRIHTYSDAARTQQTAALVYTRLR